MSDLTEGIEFDQRRIGGRPTHRLSAALIAAGIAGLAGVAFWQLVEPVLVNKSYYPNKAFRLFSVSYGTNHRITRGSPVQQLIERVWPSQLSPVHTLSTKRNSLTAWVGGDYEASTLALYDDHGCHFGRADATQPSESDRVGKTCAFVFENVPSKSQRLWLRPNYEKPFAFRAPYDARPVLSEMQPGKEPEGKSGDLAVRLTDLEQRPWGGRDSFGARFEVRERGKVTSDWRLLLIEVTDVFGNRVATALPSAPEDGVYRFAGLCAFDSVWRLRCRLGLTHPQRRPPDACWQLGLLPMPPPGQDVRELDRRLASNNMRVDLDLIESRARWWEDGYPGSSLYLSVPYGSPPLIVGVRAEAHRYTKSLGVVVDLNSWDENANPLRYSPGDGASRAWPVPLDPGGKPLKAIVEAWKTPLVDFTINPTARLQKR